MLRLLAIAVLAILLWLVLNWLFNRAMHALGIDPSPRGRGAARTRPAGRSGSHEAELLVRCAACGTYVPASRALPVSRSSGGPVACSEACRERLRAGAGRT